jgi:secretion/DNA translocation related TadE-like protein
VSRAGAEDRGSATLFAVAVIGVLVLVGAALGVVAAMVHAHRVAQSAADLAALAGARAHGEGADACAAAEVIAAANAAMLEGCAVEGLVVRVRVTVAGPRWLGQPHDLFAEARAGPEVN